MKGPVGARAHGSSVDDAFAEVLASGPSMPAARDVLRKWGDDVALVVSVLRRAVPLTFLEAVASTHPWSTDARVLAAVVLSPRCTRPLGLRLVGGLYWRDLADVAASPRVAMAVRVRAEEHLKEQLPDLRLGERITLAKIATPAVLRPLLDDAEPKVAASCLINRHLREEDLVGAIRRDIPSRPLIEAAAASRRWSESYAVRLALALQPRTPIAIALAQLTRLLDRDLRAVMDAAEVTPVVQRAAERVMRDR